MHYEAPVRHLHSNLLTLSLAALHEHGHKHAQRQQHERADGAWVEHVACGFERGQHGACLHGDEVVRHEPEQHGRREHVQRHLQPWARHVKEPVGGKREHAQEEQHERELAVLLGLVDLHAKLLQFVGQHAVAHARDDLLGRQKAREQEAQRRTTSRQRRDQRERDVKRKHGASEEVQQRGAWDREGLLHDIDARETKHG